MTTRKEAASRRAASERFEADASDAEAEAIGMAGLDADETSDPEVDAAVDPAGEADDDPQAEAAAAESAFVLGARMRVAETEALLAWLRRPDASGPVVLDAGAVETMSTPCALAIVAAARAGAAAGTPAAVARPSPAFVDAFSDLGLFQDLMKMEFRP